MSVMRFHAANSRDAMRQVRETLGDEALILANRPTDGGVEILAMAESAAHADAADATSAPAAPPSAPPLVRPRVDAPASEAFAAMSERLLEEMRDMRALLAGEAQRQEPAPAAEELATAIRTRLCGAGFSADLAEEVIAALPEELAAAGATLDEPALAWLKRQLVGRLAGLADEAALLEHTGVIALIGPTGVGKTTTTAKLAARYVMRHGTRPVALVTTDSFRIGAHEQLRIYARLLDVPMYALSADQPVNELLGRMQGKSWVIIDTVGMSQRDQRIIEQVSHLRGTTAPVRLVLLLNAASQPETLEEVVLRYRQAAQAAGAELVDCVITKQDEAGRLAPVLDIVMRHGLRPLFVSHGQRVPEDMTLADPASLVETALQEGANAPQAASPHAMAAPPPALAATLLGQGRRLAMLLQALRQRLTGFVELERVWGLLGLPAVVQQQRLEALWAGYPVPGQALGLLWSERRRVAGEAWSMPDVALDADGHWLALPLPQHCQVAGQRARLVAAEMACGASVHLMAGPPDAEACAWLESEARSWVGAVRGSQRVVYQGERQALATLSALAEPQGIRHCRYRGAPARLALASLPVMLVPKGARGAPPLAVRAWFGELSDPESGRRLARRYWVTPARLGEEPVPLLLYQLHGDGLTTLTRRAWQQLDSAAVGELRADTRLLLASGVATVAVHLELADDAAGRDLRGELLRMTGGRRRRRDMALLEALLQVFLVRDAIRHLGSGEREAE